MEKKLSKGQTVMLLVLYALIVLMIVFSTVSGKNSGQEGYDKCIEWKCQKKGDEYCSKAREINNCCSGASGELTSLEGELICVF
jgi:hypothetical protein